MNRSRRRLLKGLTLGSSSVLLTPFLQRLVAETAETYTPRRFVFVMEGNGFDPKHAQPQTIDREVGSDGHNSAATLQDISLTGHTLATAMQPLDEFRDRLTIIQGLSGCICGGGHSNSFGALGAYPGHAGAFGETIDLALTRNLPAIFPQVGLGISQNPRDAAIYNVSASARGRKIATQCRPDLAHARLFGSVADNTSAGHFKAQTSLLDFMVDDVKRVQRRLGSADLEKLDHYLDAFESLRDQQGRLAGNEDRLRQHLPEVTGRYSSPVETDRLIAHCDLGAAALISGLTNVLTIASGCGEPWFNVRFGGLGIELGKHAIGHGGSLNGVPCEDMAIRIRQFHFQQMAHLARRLASVPEAGGSMLDHTLIVYLSDAAEAHHSTCREWPVVLLGNLERQIKAGDRFLCYPKYGDAGHRTMANLYTTLLNASGNPVRRFGLPDPAIGHLNQDGPLEELLVS
jgi:hypothetical protein